MSLVLPDYRAPGAARRRGPSTSKQAARFIEVVSGSQRMDVLHAIAASHPRGITQIELAEQLGLLRSSVTGRCWELTKEDNGLTKWVKVEGKRYLSGHMTPFQVYVLSDAGVREYRRRFGPVRRRVVHSGRKFDQT